MLETGYLFIPYTFFLNQWYSHGHQDQQKISSYSISLYEYNTLYISCRYLVLNTIILAIFTWIDRPDPFGLDVGPKLWFRSYHKTMLAQTSESMLIRRNFLLWSSDKASRTDVIFIPLGTSQDNAVCVCV